MEQPIKAMLFVWWQAKAFDTINLQFNPTEMSFNKGAQIAEIAIPGLDSPILQFVRGQTETLTLDLFFDSTDTASGGVPLPGGFEVGAAPAEPVTKQTDRIYELLKIEPERHAPPTCTLIWSTGFPGSQVSHGSQRRTGFNCIVESVRQRFTLFSSLGVPLRATLTVTFKEYKTLDEQLLQLKLNSPDRTQSHVIQAGDTLSGIAGKHYLKPGEWRRLAVANGIEDPRRLNAGAFVEVPPIP
jgi:nucleoid-associated protein YgaU